MTSKFNSVGEVLKKLRQENKESYREQGERLNVNPSYIHMISKGRRKFSYSLYQAITTKYEETEKYEKVLKASLIEDGLKNRFITVFPQATIEQMFYVIYGGKCNGR